MSTGSARRACRHSSSGAPTDRPCRPCGRWRGAAGGLELADLPVMATHAAKQKPQTSRRLSYNQCLRSSPATSFALILVTGKSPGSASQRERLSLALRRANPSQPVCRGDSAGRTLFTEGSVLSAGRPSPRRTAAARRIMGGPLWDRQDSPRGARGRTEGRLGYGISLTRRGLLIALCFAQGTVCAGGSILERHRRRPERSRIIPSRMAIGRERPVPVAQTRLWDLRHRAASLVAPTSRTRSTARSSRSSEPFWRPTMTLPPTAMARLGRNLPTCVRLSTLRSPSSTRAGEEPLCCLPARLAARRHCVRPTCPASRLSARVQVPSPSREPS